MGGHEARSYWEHAGLLRLIGSFLLAPLAWFPDLQISYALVKWACANDRGELLLLVPLGSLSFVLLAGWTAWVCWAALRHDAQPAGGRMEDRSAFLALAALGTSAVFGLLILTSVIPRVVLGPCE